MLSNLFFIAIKTALFTTATKMQSKLKKTVKLFNSNSNILMFVIIWCILIWLLPNNSNAGIAMLTQTTHCGPAVSFRFSVVRAHRKIQILGPRTVIVFANLCECVCLSKKTKSEYINLHKIVCARNQNQNGIVKCSSNSVFPKMIPQTQPCLCVNFISV